MTIPYRTVSALLMLAFPLVVSAQPLTPVSLGTAGNFVVLAKAAISTVPPSAITGDIGVSPAAQTFITGFSLTTATGYATSTQVTGRVYAADQTAPTPTMMTTAISDMETAYTDAAGRSNPDFTEFQTGHIGGAELEPGLYIWAGTVSASADFSLVGGPNDVWIFQIAGGLQLATNVNVTLSGGAQAANVFWQVAGAVNIGTSAHMEGVILTATAVDMGTSATLNGRLLAQTAVNLNANAITAPVLTGLESTREQGPDGMTLSAAYPNPFNPTTQIGWSLEAGSSVTLGVYDMLGREVAVLVDGYRAAGAYTSTFDAAALPSGLYLYRLSTGSGSRTGLVSLVR